jgi:hypothetical protein
MASKAVLLDLASFMDSPLTQGMEGIQRDQIKSIAGKFLAVCHDQLGKRPCDMDGQDMHGALGHLLPARFERKDPLAELAPEVLRAYLQHLEETEVVAQSFELRNGLETTMDEFLETVRTGNNPHHNHHEPQKPLKHGAPRLGRNDPCSCGSGKKFKKCHGK